jgi:hypothetical protein
MPLQILTLNSAIESIVKSNSIRCFNHSLKLVAIEVLDPMGYIINIHDIKLIMGFSEKIMELDDMTIQKLDALMKLK